MMTFYKAPHKAMLSYATIRSSEERRNMHRELEHTRQMLQACVCGIAVTLIGGIILGACMVGMVG